MKVKSLIGVFSLIGAMCCFTLASCDDDYSKYDASVYLPEEPVYDDDGGDGDGEGGTAKADSIDGYPYVDLGVSVYWATINLGATYPEDYGHYYRWAEITPLEDIFGSDYLFDGVNENISGNPEYDAAAADWGGGWRIPTEDEFNEMLDNVELEWTRYSGILGFEVTSTLNDKSFFIPAGGQYGYGTEGVYVYYWTSIPDGTSAIAWVRGASENYNVSGWARSNGKNIRAVHNM